MFYHDEVYFDKKGIAWTVNYKGISFCKTDVVIFSGMIDGKKYWKTLDATEAYNRLADGDLSWKGQMELFI